MDILPLDALYAHAPVLGLAGKIGWDAVISLKQNSRDSHQSLGYRRPAVSHRPTRNRCGWCAPKTCWSATATAKGNGPHKPPARNGFGSPRFRNGLSHAGRSPTWAPPLETGEQRLDKPHPTGAFKHGFLHACQHRLKQTNASDNGEPIPNRGVAASRLDPPDRLGGVRRSFSGTRTKARLPTAFRVHAQDRLQNVVRYSR